MKYQNIYLLFLLFFSTGFSYSDTDTCNNAEEYNLKRGIALNGFDPVTYFLSKPEKGKSSFQHTHKGVVYCFATEVNKDKFIAEPEKYQPQCGGWCAYAMAESGKKVSINPYCFKIINGKLYLFYKRFGINTLKKWEKNETEFLTALAINWKKYCR
jgi:YHS domain-containing protein